jgi:hypothetical protein
VALLSMCRSFMLDSAAPVLQDICCVHSYLPPAVPPTGSLTPNSQIQGSCCPVFVPVCCCSCCRLMPLALQTPQPVHLTFRDAPSAAQGSNYLCYRDICQQQCSAEGRTCAAVTDPAIRRLLPSECLGKFDKFGTSHLCVPDSKQALASLSEDFAQQLDELKSVGGLDCHSQATILACFQSYRECVPGDDIKLPLCANTCEAFTRCSASGTNPCDHSDIALPSAASPECSGSNNPNDFLQTGTIVAIALSASLLLAILVLLALYCYARRAGGPLGTWLCSICCCEPAQLTPVSSESSSRTAQPLRGDSDGRDGIGPVASRHPAGRVWLGNPMCCLISPRRPMAPRRTSAASTQLRTSIATEVRARASACSVCSQCARYRDWTRCVLLKMVGSALPRVSLVGVGFALSLIDADHAAGCLSHSLRCTNCPRRAI